MQNNQKRETATLAGGCFWCLEPIFDQLKGVIQVIPGYAGGDVCEPSYQEVCSGTTGHAEAVQITFNPEVISFEKLLEVFFSIHDPTTLNRQGADVGTHYRSAIFYHSEEQWRIAENFVKRLSQQNFWQDPIVTEVVPFTNFFPAEDYHHGYYRQNPGQGYCCAVIAPKISKFRRQHEEKLKE